MSDSRRDEPSWRPFLSGSLADEARRSVAAIAESLRELAEKPDPFLSDGSAGVALFYAYLALARDDEGHAETALDHLSEAMDGAAEELGRRGLFGGLAGPAWVVEHLRGRLLDADEEDPNDEIDEVLTSALEKPWPGLHGFDLMAGLVGIGVYALERLPRRWARHALERVVAGLLELAQERDGGLAWFSDPRDLDPTSLAEFPLGYYNLGVAHGPPAVIALAARVLAAEIAPEAARSLFDGALSWFLSNQIPGTCHFPSWKKPGEYEPRPARSAWCYGNPGIATALLGAARALGDEGLERRAVELALGSAARPPEEAAILDACLCHGAAGLGHQFNRLYQATGEEPLAEAARFWYARALEMRQPGAGMGGYPTMGMLPDGGNGWIDDPGMLSGAAGIGLCLLAATTSLEPAWDRLFLISPPEG